MKWSGSLAATVVALWGLHEWIGSTHLPNHLVTKAQAQTLTDELRREVTRAVDAAKGASETATKASNTATATAIELRIFLKQQEVSRLEGELSQTALWESQNGENDVSRRLKRDLGERLSTARRQLACLNDPAGDDC